THVTRLKRQLRGDLTAILRKALAKAPEERYRSMDAMIADLDAYLDKRPVTARRAGTAYHVWRFLARRPYVSLGAAAAALALALSSFLTWRQARIAEQQAFRAESINSFLVGLFKVSDPDVNRGDKLTANQILDQGAERVSKEFANQPEQRARLESTIAD